MKLEENWIKILIGDILKKATQGSISFKNRKQIVNFIAEELRFQGIVLPEDTIIKMLNDFFSNEIEKLIIRKKDLKSIVFEYMKSNYQFKSIKDLAVEIANKYNLNVHSVYSRLLFMASAENEIANYIKSLKNKRRESLEDAILLLVDMMSENRKVIPLIPSLLGVSEEKIDVIVLLLNSMDIYNYKIEKKKNIWCLVKKIEDE